MDPAYTTLFTLAQAASILSNRHGRMSIAAPGAIVADLLAGTSLETGELVRDSTLTDLRGPVASLASDTEALRALAEQIDQILTDDLAGRFAAATGALEDLLLIDRMLRSTNLQTATIEVRDLRMFDYLQRWDIPPRPGAPPTSIVGFLRCTSDVLSVQLPSEHFTARRTALGYERATPYPRLSVKTSSAAPISAMRGERTAWEQRSGAEYRLKIFTGMLKPAGFVQTEPLPMPLTIENDRMHLMIPATAPIAALATDFSDTDGQVIARCIRLYERP